MTTFTVVNNSGADLRPYYADIRAALADNGELPNELADLFTVRLVESANGDTPAVIDYQPPTPKPENNTELRQLSAFEAGEDSPLFTGTPQTAKANDYNTEAQPDQPALFDRQPLIGMPKRAARPASPPIIGGLFD